MVFSRYGAYKLFLAYDYSNVTVEAYMASVIALEGYFLSHINEVKSVNELLSLFLAIKLKEIGWREVATFV